MAQLGTRIDTLVNLLKSPCSQKIFNWPDHAEISTFARNSQMPNRSHFSAKKFAFEEKPQFLIGIHLKTTPDQNSNCTRSVLRYLPSHFQNIAQLDPIRKNEFNSFYLYRCYHKNSQRTKEQTLFHVFFR